MSRIVCARHRIGDEGIAVAVAADPRAKLKKRRYLELLVRIMLLERALEGGEQIRREIENRLRKEVLPPGDFMFDGRLFEMQLARQPQEFDLIAHRPPSAFALAIGPARRFEIAQQQINAAVLLQNRNALGFGRMRRYHRTDAQRLQLRADFVRADAGARGAGQHLIEGAEQLIMSALALDTAAPAHRIGLFGDRDELEQNALRLQGAAHLIVGELRAGGEASQHRFDLRHVALDDQHELIDEKGRRLLDGARGEGRGRGGGRRVGEASVIRNLELRDGRYGKPRRLMRFGLSPLLATRVLADALWRSRLLPRVGKGAADSFDLGMRSMTGAAIGRDAPNHARCRTLATVSPNSAGLGATVRP